MCSIQFDRHVLNPLARGGIKPEPQFDHFTRHAIGSPKLRKDDSPMIQSASA
jgi:hypothetical protein